MPRKSVAEIEQEVFEAVQSLTLPAAGLWLKMRYLIERVSDRPGHLQRDGRPISGSALAIRAGADHETVSQLLRELADAGLVEVSEKERHIVSPRLAQIHEIRALKARQTTSSRERRKHKDLRGPTNRGCNRDVSELSKPPPPQVSSPPITPSSSYPSPDTHTPGAAAPEPRPDPPPPEPVSPEPVPDPSPDLAAGDDIDARIRSFLGQHPRVLYSPVAHSNVRKMVESGGWHGMVEALDDAIAYGAGEPTSYAVRILSSGQAKRRIDGRRRREAQPKSEPLNRTKVYDA